MLKSPQEDLRLLNRPQENDPPPYLAGLGLPIKRHLKENRPKMYGELEQSGQLDQYCLDAQERALDVLEQALKRELAYDQAQELVNEEAFLPAESDLPELGSNPETPTPPETTETTELFPKTASGKAAPGKS